VDEEAIRFFIGVGQISTTDKSDLVAVGTEVYVPVVRMPSFHHQHSVEVKITDTT
jgi:hypothetical protein